MRKTNYLPTNDLLFKKLLSSKEHSDILLHFVNDMTGGNFTSVHINNTYSIANYKKELLENTNTLYTTIVDVSATTNTGVEVIIEMQLHNHTYFIERTLFYALNTYTTEYNKQKKYTNLKPVYAINLLNFKVFKDEKFCRSFDIIDTQDHFKLVNDHNQELLKLFYIILPNATDNTILKYWQQFFTTGVVDYTAPDYLKSAQKIVDFHNLTQEEQRMITREDIKKSDAEAILEYALTQGEQNGIEKGRQDGILQTARNMLMEKTDISFISKVTGLSIQDIEKIVL